MRPHRLPQQRPLPAVSGLALLLAPLLLSGCSGSGFGEALSRSFPLPGSAPPAPAGPDRGGATGATPAAAGRADGNRQPTAEAQPSPAGRPAATPAAGSGVLPRPARPGAQPPPGQNQAASAPPSPGSATAASPRTPAQPVAQPAPYRVTIRLPQADPSAPAEVVTEALRAAGVPFEVETIERMSAGVASGTAQPSSSTVQTRPAPMPR